MLQFYNPNAKNSGCSCTFSFNVTEKSMFASLMRQFSWDSSKRRGSFAGNKDNPKAKVAIKFSMTEAAGFIDTINSNRTFSAYHTSSNQVTKIQFSPYIRDDKQLGFTLMVSKEAKDDSTDKNKFLIGFNFPESCLLKEFLSDGLRQCFVDNRQKTQPQPEPTRSPKIEIEESDLNFSPSQSNDEEDEIW